MLGRSRNDGLLILWIQSESNELDIVNVQDCEQVFLIPCCHQKNLYIGHMMTCVKYVVEQGVVSFLCCCMSQGVILFRLTLVHP